MLFVPPQWIRNRLCVKHVLSCKKALWRVAFTQREQNACRVFSSRWGWLETRCDICRRNIVKCFSQSVLPSRHITHSQNNSRKLAHAQKAIYSEVHLPNGIWILIIKWGKGCESCVRPPHTHAHMSNSWLRAAKTIIKEIHSKTCVSMYLCEKMRDT